jgi:hypothetical protein
MPFRYYAVNADNDVLSLLEKIGQPLEPYVDEWAQVGTHLCPGAGLARFLLDLFEKEQMQLIVLSWFTADGGIF